MPGHKENRWREFDLWSLPSYTVGKTWWWWHSKVSAVAPLFQNIFMSSGTSFMWACRLYSSKEGEEFWRLIFTVLCTLKNLLWDPVTSSVEGKAVELSRVNRREKKRKLYFKKETSSPLGTEWNNTVYGKPEWTKCSLTEYRNKKKNNKEK